MKKLIPLIVLLMLSTFSVLAQDSNRYVCITMHTGIQRCGYLINDDGKEITIETKALGKVILLKENVVSIFDATEGTIGSSSADADFIERSGDPNRTIQPSRYFFAPSAHTLKQNEGYGELSIVAANISYGITDQTMLGMSVSFLGGGFNFKQSIKLDDKAKISFGGMFQLSWGNNDSPIMFPFMNLTLGGENDHITFNVGHLLQSSSEINSPMLNISGTKKISNKLSFISENYYFVNPEFFPVNLVLSAGMRHYGQTKNRLTDFAFMIFIEDDGNATPVPWLSYTWPF